MTTTPLTPFLQAAERAKQASSRLRVLSIEGSDPIGGAGTMADMKVFTALGAYGYAAMTSVVAQNTQGVTSIVNMDADFLSEQLRSVADDAHIDAIKIGMLGTSEMISTVQAWLQSLQDAYAQAGERKPVVVIDPVMFAKSGDALLEPAVRLALRELLPFADMLTPNIPELAALLDIEPATSFDELREQAMQCAKRYQVCVYAKSGALAAKGAADASDVLVMHNPQASAEDGVNELFTISGKAVPTSNVHGTGDSLSSALAALRLQSDSWLDAARRAKAWITGAIAGADALKVGKGHGPIDFTWQQSPTGFSYSADYWNRVKPIRDRIRTMPFIQQMLDASLPLENFSAYIHQDDNYLKDFTSLLALAASRADRYPERAFFAECAKAITDSEVGFHHDWYIANGFDPARVPLSEASANYIGHEHRVADQGLYATLIAVVMPCFWLYAEVGAYMNEQVQERHLDLDTHPYGSWIRTYASEGFHDSVAKELAICDRVAAESSHEVYEEMMSAALISSEHEYLFFNQAAVK